MKALVIGTGKGGKTVAECCLKQGWEVTVADPEIGRDVAGNLSRRGATVVPEIPDTAFDICISEHGDTERGQENLSYSELVNRLFDPFDTRTRIEVTGEEGRSITCALLAHILDRAGKRTYLNIAGLMGPYAGGKLHVTDVGDYYAQNLLVLPLTEYDVLVCEVLEGGSGRADVQILTGCDPGSIGRYGTVLKRNAVVPVELGGLCPGSVTFGADVTCAGGKLEFDYGGPRSVGIQKDLPVGAVSAALAACRKLEVPAEAVCDGLASFRGVDVKPPQLSGLLPVLFRRYGPGATKRL